MSIAKTALKLQRFKTLISHTLATGVVLSPAITGYLVYRYADISQYDSPVLTLGVFIGLVFTQIATTIVSLAQAEEDIRPRYLTSAAFWNQYLDLPFKNLYKKYNEKYLFLLRELGSEVSKINEKQKKALLDYYIDAQLDAPLNTQWQQIVEKTNHLVKAVEFDKFTKHSLVKNKIDAIFNYNGALSGVLQKELSHQMGEKIKSPYITLCVKEWLNTHTKNLDVKKEYQRRAKFLLQHGYPLKDPDYQQIQNLFKKEKGSDLSTLFDVLLQYPQNVDWNRLVPMFHSYATEDAFYKKFLGEAQKLGQQNKYIIEQKEIVQDIESGMGALKEDKDAIDLKTQTQQHVLETEKKLDKFLKFTPTHFVDKWLDLQKGYRFIQSHKNELDAYELIGFMTSLQGSLSVLITSDQAVNRLPQTPVDYQEKAKKLLSENLDLALSQIHYFQAQVGEKHLKALEIHKNYQTAKMAK